MTRDVKDSLVASSEKWWCWCALSVPQLCHCTNQPVLRDSSICAAVTVVACTHEDTSMSLCLPGIAGKKKRITCSKKNLRIMSCWSVCDAARIARDAVCLAGDNTFVANHVVCFSSRLLRLTEKRAVEWLNPEKTCQKTCFSHLLFQGPRETVLTEKSHLEKQKSML